MNNNLIPNTKEKRFMRLYNIYYVCKICKENIEKISAPVVKNSSGQVIGYRINGWGDCKNVIEEVRNIKCLTKYTENVYEALGVMERDKDSPIVSPETKNKVLVSLENLRIAMQTIVALYDSLDIGESETGIDIKIPKCDSLKEYMDYLKEIDFILTQCPYLLSDDEEIKFKNVDVGSQWLTFVLVTAGTFGILNNLAKIVEKAIAIKSHLLILRQQEELVTEMKLKNEATQETLDIFRKMKRDAMEGYVKDLESELGELKDGEERGKVEKSLEKLCVLIDKGVEIYSSIDTPNEVKALFPMSENNLILPDNIVKLLEKKDE